MTSKDPYELPEEDRTVPSQPAGEGGAEDATIPSQPVEPPEDPTVLSQPVEDPTVPSGSVVPDAGADKTRVSPEQGLGAKPSGAAEQPAADKTAKIEKDAGAGGDLLGATIGGCRIDSLLGRGAMGAVYKARQLKLDRDVAVKVIRPEMMTDPRMLKRFEVEARTVGKFNSANVVMVHDVGFEAGVHYLVMEFVQGKNLREHGKMLAGGRLPAGEALPLIEQACKGLEEARRLGVVHRDIKPDNLMLTDQGVLKIADFGIAKPVQDDFSMTLTSELIGTPLYMSPEQCQGGADIDFRSDMYSLGATFFYLLTGEPPIRASSVYELIQTKTKMENLCLWKALPELDENNPLSRVIERMTANDREDRYESYEELLNDLVLVKHGETITIKPKRKKKVAAGGGGRGDDGKKGSGVLAVALTLLVLGGGGGAYWYFNQPKDPVVDPQPPGPGPGPVNAGVDAKLALQKLNQFRGRLRDNGPGGTLRTEIAGLPVSEDLQVQRDRLVADVEAGQQIQQALRAIDKPTELQLPFEDLKAYFAAVQAAGKLESAAGSEVREWMQQAIVSARDETGLGTQARATLLEQFTAWSEDRKKVRSDKARLVALGERLEAIDAGRLALGDLLPGQRGRLDDLRDRIQSARRGLENPTDVVVDVDITEVLAEIRDDFRAQGPIESLRVRVNELKPTRPEQVQARETLQNEIRDAGKIDGLVRQLTFPTSPKAPFEDVRNFYVLIDRELEPLRAADESLPPWAEALRSERRDEQRLQERVIDACTYLWRGWQDQRVAGAAESELRTRKGALELAKRRALELFPGAAESLEQAVPQATLDAAMAEVHSEGATKAWRASLAQARSRIDGVGTLAVWVSAESGIRSQVDALRTSLATLPDAASLQGEFEALERRCEKWSTAKRNLDAAAAQLAAGDLSGCETAVGIALASPEGSVQFTKLREVARKCHEAFDVLKQQLDIEKSTQQLAMAREVAASGQLPNAVIVRIEAWQRSVKELGDAASGMVAIQSGRISKPAADVEAFFMARTECSEARFAQFVQELKALATGDTTEARFAAVSQRLKGSGMSASMLDKLLRHRGRDSNKPIGRITWHEAAAFAAFYNLHLPTREEWTLAALGENNRKTYPWGDEWSTDDGTRNTTNRPVDVDRGGISWRTAELRHLGGNVAEWLASNPADRDGYVAGGRCSQRPFPQKRAAGGEAEKVSKTDNSRIDIGFRVVLRPRDFAIQWPR